MLKRGLFAIAASTLLTQAAFAHSELSFEELRQRCHELDSNDQIMPFTASLSCTEERTFWTPIAQNAIPLPNHSEIRIKAQIKDGRHSTEWWQIEVPVAEQVGTCDLVEQWRSTARVSQIMTCSDLDAIASEADFCRAALQPVWDDCEASRGQGPFQGGSDSSSSSQQGPAGACEYVRTGVVKGCEGVPVVGTSSSSSSCSSSTSHSSVSCDSHHEPSVSTTSSVCEPPQYHEHSLTTTSSTAPAPGFIAPIEAPMPQQPYYDGQQQQDLGAPVKEVGIRKNMFNKNYRVVELQDDPAAGSLLANCGFKKGDIISKIDNKRVHNATELKSALAGSRDGRALRVKYKGAQSAFGEKMVNPNR